MTRSLQEWMRRVKYDGEAKAILKNNVTGAYVESLGRCDGLEKPRFISRNLFI
jgi:hypothetical protein